MQSAEPFVCTGIREPFGCVVLANPAPSATFRDHSVTAVRAASRAHTAPSVVSAKRCARGSIVEHSTSDRTLAVPLLMERPLRPSPEAKSLHPPAARASRASSLQTGRTPLRQRRSWRRRGIRRHEADSADLVATRYEAVLAVAAPGSVAILGLGELGSADDAHRWRQPWLVDALGRVAGSFHLVEPGPPPEL